MELEARLGMYRHTHCHSWAWLLRHLCSLDVLADSLLLAQVEEHLKDVTKRSTVVDGRPRIDEPPTGLPNDGYGSLAEPFGQGQQRAYGQSQEGCVLPLSETQPKNVPHDAQLMELGLSEPLPPFEMMEELYVHGRHLRELKIPDLDRNNIYFKTHHFICPIVHPARYLQEFYSFPLRKPPLCLQYAIWATSAKFHPVHHLYAELFYERARNYLRTDEMKVLLFFSPPLIS